MTGNQCDVGWPYLGLHCTYPCSQVFGVLQDAAGISFAMQRSMSATQAHLGLVLSDFWLTYVESISPLVSPHSLLYFAGLQQSGAAPARADDC